MNFLKKLWLKILSFFRKKEEVDFPPEFAIIKFTEQAKKKGLYSDEAKEVIWMRRDDLTGEHEEFRVMNYSKSILYALRKMHTPFYDMTQQVAKLRILKKIRPEILTYEKDA